MAVANLVQISPRGTSGKWVKYDNFFYLFVYLFIPFYFMNSPIYQIRRRSFTLKRRGTQ